MHNSVWSQGLGRVVGGGWWDLLCEGVTKTNGRGQEEWKRSCEQRGLNCGLLPPWLATRIPSLK